MQDSSSKVVKPIDKPHHISLLIPTRGRPECLNKVFDSIERTVGDANGIDVWLYVDNDDDIMKRYISSESHLKYPFKTNCVLGERTPSQGQMVNTLRKNCTTNPGIYLPWIDDYIFKTNNWDATIREIFGRYSDGIVLGYIPDPTVNFSNQVTIAILSAWWANITGRLLTEFFPFWHDDTWLDDVAQSVQRKARVEVEVETIDGRGKTRRLKNLPFWKKYFINLADERLEEANLLLRAIYPQDCHEYHKRLEEAEVLAKRLMKARDYISIKHQLSLERKHSSFPEKPEPQLILMGLTLEAKAVSHLCNKADSLMQSGDFGKALRMLDNILLAEQKYKNVNYLRAVCLKHLGRAPESARAALEELSLQPDHHPSKTIIQSGETCPQNIRQSREYQLAKELFKRGSQYLRQQNPSEAMKYFDEAEIACAILPNLHFAMATAHIELRDFYSARRACETELILQPEHDGTKKLLERIDHAINEYEQTKNKARTKAVTPPEIEKSTNGNIIPHLLTSIASSQVKQRVLSALSRFQKDYPFEQVIKKYQNATNAETSWFETLTFLNWYAHHFKPSNYLEVGVGRGRSMAQVLVESPETNAYGFDIWFPYYDSLPEKGTCTPNSGLRSVTEELKSIGIANLPTLIGGNSHQTLRSFFANSNNPQQFELVFFDGDHNYQGANLDLEIAFNHLAPGGALVFDDINHHTYPRLRDLWDQYKAKSPDCICIEDDHGTGTGVIFKPPFTKLAKWCAPTSQLTKVVNESNSTDKNISNEDKELDDTTLPNNPEVNLSHSSDFPEPSKTHKIAKTQSIPIIFIQTGDQEYLKYSLAQAKISSPNSKMYLIGDASTDKYDFLEHHNIKNYYTKAETFSRVYKHPSTNRYDNELICFLRWFILRDFLEAREIDKCLYLDSDVMLYADVQQEHTKFSQYDLTVSQNMSPHCNFINGLKGLNDFCDFLLENYTDPSLLKKLEDTFQTVSAKGTKGGVCDMKMFYEYRLKHPERIGEISPIIGQSKYDHNINVSEGFEMEEGIKRVFWLNNKPYGKHISSVSPVRFNTLHFQGQSTIFLKDYFTGELHFSTHKRKWSIKKKQKELSSASNLNGSLDAAPKRLLEKADQTINEYEQSKHNPRTIATDTTQSDTMPSRRELKQSELNNIIPPEIKDDEFYYAIRKITREENIKTILEIGSSTGAGSTEAFVTGLHQNPNNPTLFCVEISAPRFTELQKRYANDSNVKCYNLSSIALEKFPTEQEVRSFYSNTKTALNNYPIERVLGWLRQDTEYMKNSGLCGNGIQQIKEENNIKNFDMVLIDGSEFAGMAELDEVYGARLILLDDINGFKNYGNYKRLINDPNYSLVTDNWQLRSGFAVFERNSNVLPVHFFTIVLNGQPFIRHHIEVFRQLPFNWHWHIIEGVADLKHDTAWSAQSGGRITNELHRNGLSNDGTTEYIDELAKRFPKNITIYRKPGGAFWDGKVEMVNAPLTNINEECLLWQIDADELWTAQQINACRHMFLSNPGRMAAYYYCWFFVAENLVITTHDTYGNNTNYEWLRTWRFKQGCRWMTHEPPCLCQQNQDGHWVNLEDVNPFLHSETQTQGLVFQHYAYVTEQQLRFKELYYGYEGAVKKWKLLQEQTEFPVSLRDYFPWVKDNALVDRIRQEWFCPLAKKNALNQWVFIDNEPLTDNQQDNAGATSSVGNVLTTSMLPHSEAKPPLADRKRKNILVVAHERSGTHFLINTIASNFPYYSNDEISVVGNSQELNKIFTKHCSKEEKRIFKSHHQFDFFKPFLDEMTRDFHIFYIVRDGRDVLTSCFHYFNAAPVDKFPHTKSISDLLMTKPSDFAFDSAYSFRRASNMIQRWRLHVESWLAAKDQITIVRFEDLKNNFDNVVARIADILGSELPAQLTVPTIKDRGISPRKGVIGDWIGYFSNADLAAFNNIASECMGKLGYYDKEFSESSSDRKADMDQSPQLEIGPTSGGQRNILWVRPDSIGDTVLAASMLPYIQQEYPDARIAVACQEHVAELYETCPFVDEIVVFDRKRILEDKHHRQEVLGRLRALKPVLSLNSVYSREPLTDVLAIECDAGERIGMEGNLVNITAQLREKHNQFYTMLLRSDGEWKLELERHRDFLRGLGINVPSLEPMVWTTPEDENFAEEFFEENKLEPERTIALFAGAQRQVRLYEKYGQALSQLCKDNHFQVIAIGNKQEWDINQNNLDAIGVRTVNLSGKLTLRQSAAILKRCRLAVGAETGLAHVACAVGTHNVILLGGGHFGRFMPYSPLTSVVSLPLECFGCNWKCRYQRPYCIRDIGTQVVAEALRQTLQHTSQKPRIFVQDDSLWEPKPEQPTWRAFNGLLDISTAEVIPVGRIPPGAYEDRKSLQLLSKGNMQEALNTFTNAIDSAPKSSLTTPENAGLEQNQAPDERNEYLVTAIVSTYNAERFIRGCLGDLVSQTLFEKGQLEIVVVNSGSQENEEAIVREYQQKHNNIVYIKTLHRERIYTAWNRAVNAARGKFVTNANTDDRHRQDALEIMANTLLANPGTALVYSDQIRTDTPNDTFANHHGTDMTRKPDYSRQRLLFGCCVGSQPMWRKSLHNEFGYFDGTLTCAGDWDFWLRISSKYKFKHIPEFLGLYYHNEDGVEHGRTIHSLYERYIVGKRYGNPYISVIPTYESRSNPLVSVIMPAYNAAEHIAAAIESVLIQNYRNFELIVVDDGSTDNTKDIIANFKDDRIIYFYQENSGPSAARSLAVKKARGQYIVPLDSDDMITPDFIAKHVMEFEKHPEADFVYCDDCLIDENDKPIRVIERQPYTDQKALIRDLFRAGFPVVPFRTCIRKSVFDKIGLYDESLLVGEDYDMMRRFVKHGLKMRHLRDALYLRRMTSESLSRSSAAQKAKCHFDVVKRFTDTFKYSELFPDVAWDKIRPEMRQLHARCLAAVTYLAIGQNYIKSNSPPIYAETAFGQACSELNDCLKMDPHNQCVRQLLQKCEFARARCANTVPQTVC